MIRHKRSHTAEVVIHGHENARKVLLWAFGLSAWFQFTPLPDDCYRIEMNDEFWHGLGEFDRRFGVVNA